MEFLFSPDIHVFYEHTSIPLAVYYVVDGRFRTFLVSEGACRMYESTVEEMMERLNGPDPLCNIVEKDEMVKAIKNFSDDDATYNVVFHEYIGPNRKLKTIHGIGTHEFTRDGRRYSIIRYDEISDSSRRNLFKDEEAQIKRQQQILYDIDDAIARSYTSVVYVDASDQSVHEVRLNRHGMGLKSTVEQLPTLRNMMDVYVQNLVYRDDVEGVLKYGDFDYVMDLLKTKNPIFHTYRTIRDGRMVYYRLKIIPFDGGKKLIYGFEHYDDQMREQSARQNEQEMHMTLLAGLSCEYETVWLIDAAIHHAKLIKNNTEANPTTIASTKEKEGRYDTLLANYIDAFVAPEDRDRVYMEMSIDNLIRKVVEGQIYHVNYVRVSLDEMRNYLQICVVKVTDANGVIHFVMGFRNIDSIIEEEKNRSKLYSMAHFDHMTNISNRRTFDEYMDSHMDETPADDLVFFSFDLNDLKETNDTFGHEAGDELIVAAARSMKLVLGQYGSLYRTGGDEFAALVNIPHEHLPMIIDELKASFAGQKSSSGKTLSISMGYVCASDEPGVSLDDMRRMAEKRMYSQKTDYYMKEGNDRRRGRRAEDG